MSELIRFVSPNARLRMVRKPAGEQIMPNGTVAITTKEVVYEFDQGGKTLRVGQDVMPDGWNEETGQYDLPQDAISWLRQTPEYGSRVIEVVPEAPDPGPLYVQIGQLTAAGDVDGLVVLGDEEASTWNREAVLDQIRNAVESLTAEPVK